MSDNKDNEGIIIFVFGCILAIGVFIGVRSIVKKSFDTKPPEAEEKIDKNDLYSEQKQKIQNTQDERRRLMQDNKRKLDEMKRSMRR